MLRYYVDDSRRLRRTTDDNATLDARWREVSSEEYDRYGADTKARYKPKDFRALQSGKVAAALHRSEDGWWLVGDTAPVRRGPFSSQKAAKIYASQWAMVVVRAKV